MEDSQDETRRIRHCIPYLSEAEEQPQSPGGIEGVVDLVLDGCLTSGAIPIDFGIAVEFNGSLLFRVAPVDGCAIDALSVIVEPTAPEELLGLQLRLVVGVTPALMA